MKKFLSFILVTLIFIFTLASCGGNEEQNPPVLTTSNTISSSGSTNCPLSGETSPNSCNHSFGEWTMSRESEHFVLCRQCSVCSEFETEKIKLDGTKCLCDACMPPVTNESMQEIPNLKPSFAWIDDDGKAAVYTKLYPWAIENNIPFTSAIITEQVNNNSPSYLSKDQIKEMNESGLVSFGSHTKNHVNLKETETDQLESEIVGSQKDIESYGVSCDFMIYPFGAIDNRGIDYVKSNYDYAFLAGGAVNQAGDHYQNRVVNSPINTYRITRISIDSAISAEELAFIKLQIDDACENNGMVVFMSHIGSTAGSYNGASSEADLAMYSQIVSYIREKGQDFESLKTVCDRFANRYEVGDYSSDNPKNYFVVGADGTTKISHLNGEIIVPDNTYSNASLPSDYPENQVTSCFVESNHATGLPNNARGVLTAYMLGSSSYRIFIPTNFTKVYMQVKSSTADEWKSWVELTDQFVEKVTNNSILDTTLPSALPDGINVSIVTRAEALERLPGSASMGYITAYKLSSSSSNTREEWQPFGSVVTYVRVAISSTEWGPWYKFEPVLVD